MIEGIINRVEIDPVKVKNRKRTVFENSEVFKNTDTFSMTKNEVQGNRMKKRPNALEKSGLAYEFPEEGELSDMKQIDIVSTQILEDEQCEWENDYMLNKMQCTVHEVGISVEKNLEESKNHCDKEGLSLDIVQKLDNLVELCKDTDNTLSLAADDVPFDTYSAMLADKRVVLMMRVQERKAMQDNHDTKTPDSTFDCHPVVKQITEKNKKLDDELEEQAEDSLVLSEEIVEVSLAESKSKEKFLSSDVDVAKQVAISIVNGKNNQSHSSPKRPLVGRLRKKLLILDVNGLLADIVSPPPKDYKADIKIARRAIFKRPFCSDFLKFCFERFDVGIWSSRTKKNVERVIDYLMGEMKHKLLFCWDLSHCTETGFNTLENKHKALVFKELRKIWEKHDPNLPWKKGDYNESNTLLLDDSPYKALLNPPDTAIFPSSYKFQDGSDNSLDSGGDLRIYLEELAAAENMQKYVQQHPFGQSAINERSLSWSFYLGVVSALSSLPTTR